LILAEYIDGWRHKRYQLGKVDCYQFVRGWIDICYPVNGMPRPIYRGATAAYQINRQYNFVDELIAAFDVVGLDLGDATMGDIVVGKLTDGLQSLHLVDDDNMLASVSPGLGLTRAPIAALQAVRGLSVYRVKGAKSICRQ